MFLIGEITDKDVGISDSGKKVQYSIRKASRGIMFNKDNKIPILYVSSDNYYKLPGGGLEDNENKIIALNREFEEEVGASIDVSSDLGMTIEYKKHYSQIQFSYVFIGKIKEILGATSFTEKEIEDGFVLNWFTIDEAISKVSHSTPNSNIGKYIKVRDLKILEFYKGNN